MKKTLLFLAAICSMTLTSTFAQSENKLEKAEKEKYIHTARFVDNWYVGFNAGGGVYLGGYNDGGFMPRIRPVFGLYVGKRITPSAEVRLQFDYAPFFREMFKNSWYEFKGLYIHADFLWNILNSFAGYKEDRVYQILPYAGAGYAQVWGGSMGANGRTCELGVTAGIINKFHVSKRVDINLEMSIFGTSQQFDKLEQAPKKHQVDGVVSASAGVTVRIGKVGFDRCKVSTKTVYVTNSSVEEEYEKFKDELGKAKAENKSLKEQIAAAPAVAVEVEVEKISVFFALNNAVLSTNELDKLNTFMKKADVKGGKKIEIVGEADKNTGNSKLNQGLSEKRAEFVKNILVTKYNIDPKDITATGIGDTANKFSQPENNRVVTITIQK